MIILPIPRSPRGLIPTRLLFPLLTHRFLGLLPLTVSGSNSYRNEHLHILAFKLVSGESTSVQGGPPTCLTSLVLLDLLITLIQHAAALYHTVQGPMQVTSPHAFPSMSAAPPLIFSEPRGVRPASRPAFRP